MLKNLEFLSLLFNRVVNHIEQSGFARFFAVIEPFAIVFVIVAFIFELNDRNSDRAVQRATMLATIVQVAATAETNDGQNPAVPIIETLVREKLNLSSLPLPRVNLSGAVLARANLREANLGGAVLNGAVLAHANLGEANLGGAVLNGADFYYANLRGANLRGTDLSLANFFEADLSKADLSGALFDGARYLTQAQLDVACGELPKSLPDSLVWQGKPCPEEKRR